MGVFARSAGEDYGLLGEADCVPQREMRHFILCIASLRAQGLFRLKVAGRCLLSRRPPACVKQTADS